ncbi:hypothetical protein MVEN_00065600 [Mycena venus]|uniref:DUF6532 domain-containing protein n=1 Tax=Mycena venus TaxID=2733690 RepID=A0A8H7DH58_9AGAR|nr:hypothetical protein MVEN_00065600 [Mycena venus]
MSTQSKLTPAEKRRATIAAKAQKELEENIAFQNQTAGDRKAKKDAQKNAIWKVDQSGTRKRTSSTASQVSGPAKKAREMEPAGSDNEAEEDTSKPKSKARKHRAPPIDINTDESEPEASVKPGRRIDFTNLPAKTKSAINPSVARSKAAKHSTSTARKTASKEESTASSEDSEEDAEDSDCSSDNGDLVDVKDFIAEVPQVVSTRSKATTKPSEDINPSDVTKKVSPQALFDSDSEEYEVVVSIPKKKSAGKLKPRTVPKADSDSDDSMPDAPLRRAITSDPSLFHGFKSCFAVGCTKGPRRDSNIEFAEAMADALVSIPMARHSRRSSMGSVYSSGRDLSVPASEMESDDGLDKDIEPKAETPLPRKKKTKVSAARQQQADSEKPEIKSAAVLGDDKGKGKAPVDTASRPESSWDISAQLVLPAPNKDIGLTAQHPELQGVLRDAMVLIKIFMLFFEAYPLMATRAGFGRPYLIEAAEARQPGAFYILQRLLTDPSFGAILAPIPIDRMNILRGNFKRCAVNCVLAFFGLADLQPDQVKARVEELLKDHRYIFPSTAGRLQLDQPFRHGSIRFVIKEEVFSNSSFVTQNIDRFPARHEKKPMERELPDPMVALGATAVYASLLEYRTTGRRQNIPFTEDAYEDIYRNHMATLSDIRKNAKRSLHQLLHELFVEVTEGDRVAHTASGSSSTLIQLVDLPDSD